MELRLGTKAHFFQKEAKSELAVNEPEVHGNLSCVSHFIEQKGRKLVSGYDHSLRM
jgi:hypothetical protein